MLYDIVHRTTYTYVEPVTLCHNEAHLTPRTTERQIGRHSSLSVLPAPTVMRTRFDYFDNVVSHFTIQSPHRTLQVIAQSQVELEAPLVPNPSDDASWETVVHELAVSTDPGMIENRTFALPSPFVPNLEVVSDYCRQTFVKGRGTLDAIADLVHRIHADFIFDPHSTSVATPLSEAFRLRRGVCQDFAHIAIACLRRMGFPARYVSGYLETIPPEGQQRLTGADASHAWVQVFHPEFGWIDLDPTNDQLFVRHHILLAWGRDYGDVTPLKGIVVGGSQHSLDVSVDVTRVEPEKTSSRSDDSAPSIDD